MAERKPTKPTSEPITITEIPLSLPPRDTPMPAGHQTLLSLIDSQRPRDAKGNPILPRRRKPTTSSSAEGANEGDNNEDNSAEPSEEEEGEEEDLVGPLATSFFWTVPLTFLLIAFEVVVHQQYSQELVYSQILTRCAKAFPILLALIRLIHPHRMYPITQASFFIFSITAGCWLVHAANRQAYYNVMKRAPPVGVLWIWAAAEMELGWLVGSCLVVGGWGWWGGYEFV